MKTRRQSFAAMRPAAVALLAVFATLGLLLEARGEEQHERFRPPPKQTAPPVQRYQSTTPMQDPAARSPGGTWQSNPAGLNKTMHGLQYNPPGLNSTSSFRQYNPPGLNSPSAAPGTSGLQGTPNPNRPTMAMPGGIANAGDQTASQGAPGAGAPGPSSAGQAAYGSAYPVGYQGPSGVPPPYGYQAPPAYARQFTCRTVHYLCLVPSTGACQCENDRREREPGATVD